MKSTTKEATFPSTALRETGWKTVEVNELTVLLSFGGGKNSASGWQRWIYPTGIPSLEPVLAIVRFIVGRNETGVGTNLGLPFHRAGCELEDFVTYPMMNSGLKDDGELQGLLREWVKSHGLRGGVRKSGNSFGG